MLNMKKRDKNKRNKTRKRVIIIIILGIIALILALFGAKIYLIINLLIGNDVLVRVNADKENLFLYHNQSEVIKIKTDILANPFCTVYCNYSFRDISYNNLLESNNFSLKSINPVLKEFELNSPLKGTGQILYGFEIECNSKKTYFCDTSEEIKSRTLLLTLNYNLTEDESKLKQDSKQELIQILTQLDYISINLNIFDFLNSDLSNYIDFSILNNQSLNIKSLIYSINSTAKQSELLWKDQNYQELSVQLEVLKQQIEEINYKFNNLNKTLYDNLTSYNILADKIEMTRFNLRNLQNLTVSNTTLIEINKTLNDFKNFNLILNQNYTINHKLNSITNLENKTFQLLELAQKDKDLNLSEAVSTEQINNLSLIKGNFKNQNSSFEPVFNDPESECCLFGKCEKCCDDSCSKDESKFPILFIPGHSFNKEIFSDYIFHSFNDIQNALEKDGYLNAGSIFTSYNSEKGVWGKVNYPLTVGSSYYFDILKNTQGETLLESKADNIDTYALRLNDIIKTLKEKTNKDKVIIVTYSMGGLVARRYIQIFGDSSVSNLIMIASPNKGISGSTLSYCPIFGSKIECDDMNQDSLFMNKLNNGGIPKIPIYNLIGIGCNTDGEAGDGVIKNSSAYLDWANNYYINSSCGELFQYSHVEILNINKYPEVLNIIKSIENSSITDF
jgi:hypothetical protein